MMVETQVFVVAWTALSHVILPIRQKNAINISFQDIPMMHLNHIIIIIAPIYLILSSSLSFNDKPQERIGIRAKYTYTQKLSEGKSRVDTLALDISGVKSMFYDISVERKKDVEAHFYLKMDTMKVANNYSNEYEKLLALNDPSNENIVFSDCISSVIYKDRSSNSIIMTDGNSHIKLALSEIISPQHWTFIEDTCTIEDYLCHKAITSFRGRDYIAWFSLDIPVDDGPWKFYGLPGLILKVEDSRNNICFDCCDIAILNNVDVEMPDITSYEKCKNPDQMYRFQENKAKNLIGGFIKKRVFTAYKGGASYKPVQLEIDD